MCVRAVLFVCICVGTTTSWFNRLHYIRQVSLMDGNMSKFVRNSDICRHDLA